MLGFLKVILMVESKNGQHQFVALIREAKDLESFHLEPEEFYKKWGLVIPDPPHHEIEIAQPGEEFFRQHKLHIHRSRKTNVPFVCYPTRMGTMDEAKRVFRTWCLGSVATIVEGIDLNTIYTLECGCDAERMEKLLRERHEIYIEE